MGQEGPRTALKCRIRGMRLAEERVSIMTATFGLLVMFAGVVGVLWVPNGLGMRVASSKDFADLILSSSSTE